VDAEIISRYHSVLLSPYPDQISEAEKIQLVQKGALASLFECGDPGCIRLMLDVVRSHPWSELQNLAYHFVELLAGAGNQDARDAICDLLVQDEDARAFLAAVEGNYLPSDKEQLSAYLLLTQKFSLLRESDPGLALLTTAYQQAKPGLRRRLIKEARKAGFTDWIEIVSAVIDGSPNDLASLVAHLPNYPEDPMRRTGLDLLVDHADHGDEAAREAVLDLWIDQAYPPAREQAMSRGYLPKDAGHRALYYFLTEQWQPYEDLDFNQSLLAQCYAHANPGLRRRIVAQTRRVGRVEWIQTIARGRRIRWLAEMGDTDWFTVFEQLTRDLRWEELWRLAQLAPPVWSAPMLVQLQKSGWKAGRKEDRAGFDNLVNLASQCIGTEIGIHSPLSLTGLPQEITSLAISHAGSMLAAGTAQTGISLWHLPERRLARTIAAPAGPVWSLDFSPDGEYLTSGHGDHSIRVWNASGGRLVKTLEGHGATVRCLAVTPDNRTLISGSFDTDLKLWRFPFGPEQKTLHGHSSEIFTLVLDPGGQIVASGGADRTIYLWTLSSGANLRRLEGHTDTVTSLAISPDGGFLISGSRDKSIRIWSFPEGKPVAILEGHSSLVTALAVHPERKFFASGSYDGKILFWSLPEGKLLQAAEDNAGSVTGLVMTSDGETLISAGKEGSLLAWDLRPLVLVRLPVERVKTGDIERIQATLKDPRLAQVERKWYEFCLALVQWRQRFDIELVEPPPIRVGEFDIEIASEFDTL